MEIAKLQHLWRKTISPDVFSPTCGDQLAESPFSVHSNVTLIWSLKSINLKTILFQVSLIFNPFSRVRCNTILLKRLLLKLNKSHFKFRCLLIPKMRDVSDEPIRNVTFLQRWKVTIPILSVLTELSTNRNDFFSSVHSGRPLHRGRNTSAESSGTLLDEHGVHSGPVSAWTRASNVAGECFTHHLGYFPSREIIFKIFRSSDSCTS